MNPVDNSGDKLGIIPAQMGRNLLSGPADSSAGDNYGLFPQVIPKLSPTPKGNQ